MASSSFSSSDTFPWLYHVFLSFRLGEDTCDTFIAHLYHALVRKGFHTFIDEDEVKRGNEISPALLQAIEDSRISIIVLSKNYASSTCCLDELLKILECQKSKQQPILPVFYQVNPSDIQNERGSFGEALAKHAEKLNVDMKKLQLWKAALQEVAKSAGFVLENGNEDSERIEAIVQQVSLISLENYRSYLYVAKHPVGLIHCEQWPIHHVEDHVKNLRLTSIGANDVRMVGIFGYGGVGKTTLTKAIYNSISFQFEASYFLENIRRTSNQEYGLAQLQKTLLSKISGDGRSLKVDNIDMRINMGIYMIKCSLHSKRVLLILDDVDHADQLEVLAGHRDWFGKGSRIIITTRDEEFVIRSRVDFKYEIIAFNHDVAVQLFPYNALQREITFDGFRKFVEQMIMIDKGDPLVSTVFCSDFYGRSESVWIQALDQDKKIACNNIYSGFQTIWDGLSGNEKNIFLDIACFFIGDVFDDVIKILDSFDFFPNIWIPRLMEKCLIYKCEERLQMHDRFRDMGRDLVRQESPQNPRARSRLFFHKDVREVLEKDTGTDRVEAILVDLPKGSDIIRLSPKAIKKITRRLRFFRCRNAHFLA